MSTKILLFNADTYAKKFFTAANAKYNFDLHFVETKLDENTVALTRGHQVVCCFANDVLNQPVLEQLVKLGIKLIALRTAGYNNIDLQVAHKLGLTVVYVPNYSPHAVAEHATALILALNRNIVKAYHHAREGNFSLRGLLGFDLASATVGVIGTGKIGGVFVQIMCGFGARVLAHDQIVNPLCQGLGAEYVTLEKLFSESDIISLHCPLTDATRHIIDASSLATMRDGVMLINTSRGGLVDSEALLSNLKSGKIGYLGLDVYEEEQDLFFQDLSEEVIADDIFMRLQTFPNVLITCHQGFLTRQAFSEIAATTLLNVQSFFTGTGKIFKI